MKPEFFQIKSGCYKIGINPFYSELEKKPVVRIECIENSSYTVDGEYCEDIECAMFTFRNIADYDMFIKKLQDARSFLHGS